MKPLPVLDTSVVAGMVAPFAHLARTRSNQPRVTLQVARFACFNCQLHARACVLTVMRLLVCATLLFVLSQYQVNAGDVAHVVSATIFMSGFGDMFASLGFIAGGFAIEAEV